MKYFVVIFAFCLVGALAGPITDDRNNLFLNLNDPESISFLNIPEGTSDLSVAPTQIEHSRIARSPNDCGYQCNNICNKSGCYKVCGNVCRI